MKTNETRTDFRALCAELADELQGYKVAHPMHCRALLNRARAALAQPEPQGFTDGELPMPAAIRDMPEQQQRWYALGWQAALARWGRPAIEPVPQGPSETAWALAQLLDGVQRHDLPNMTGLSDSDCDRIWAARPATTGEQQ